MPKLPRPWERKSQPSNKTVVNGVANGRLDDFTSTRKEVTNTFPYDDSSKELVYLTKADKQAFEDKLKSIRQIGDKKIFEVVPIWTLEDADGQTKEKVQESPETQGRYKKYAEQGTAILWTF